MFWRDLEDVLKTFWGRLREVLNTFWRHLGKMSWRRLENVLKTSSEDVRLRRRYSSWRRLLKTKMKDIFKRSSRRLHQDECLLGIWDISIILAYFESLPANSEVTLKYLTEKLSVLLFILSEQQKQTLLTIDIDNAKIYEDKLIILPKSSLKHTEPSWPLQAKVYHKFNGNAKLCVVECAKR